MAVLSSIHIYPIKSCGGVSVDSATVSGIGLAGDRVWQVVDENLDAVTQRSHPELATVRPALVPGGGLRLAASGLATITVDRPKTASLSVPSPFGDPMSAGDAGDEAAGWLSELVHAERRLVRMAVPSGWRLPADLDVFHQSAAFSDAAPVLVTNQASLSWLNERAAADFGMDRFRPNLVVEALRPWEEDTWQAFSIGEAQLRTGLPWPRCAIPQIDQLTGERHKEPARVLKAHRWCAEVPSLPDPLRKLLEGNALFGIGCAIGPAGVTIRVGDEALVSATAAPIVTMP